MSLIQNVPDTKYPKPQKVPTKKCPEYKTSQLHNIFSLKSSELQNILNTKRPKLQKIPATKCTKLQVKRMYTYNLIISTYFL